MKAALTVTVVNHSLTQIKQQVKRKKSLFNKLNKAEIILKVDQMVIITLRKFTVKSCTLVSTKLRASKTLV